MTVKRLGIAWVFEISYEATDPNRAAEMANAVADAYIADQLEAKYQATRQASAWLEGRIKEVREQNLAAQNAVVEYKAKNNIIDAGGRLVSDQQLGELNTQLATARGQASDAKAKLDRVNAVVQSTSAGGSSEFVTDVVLNDTIGKLRSQLVDLTNKESDWSTKFGANNVAVVNLRTQISQVRSAILDELHRVAESSKSDYDLALKKEKNLEDQVAQAIARTEALNRAQVTLRQLQDTATASKDLYDNLNKRYMESVEQQSNPVSEARILTRAVRPLDRDYKSTFKILAVIFASGMSIGLGIAAVREFADGVFRTVSQVERRLRLNCITLVPRWDPSEAHYRPPDGRALAKARTIEQTESPAWAVPYAPLSSYAEAMRSIKLAIDLSGIVKASRVIGLTSSLPREGKSTIAASLALTMGRAGARVILLDFDLRNPALTRMLAPNAPAGLLEVLSGKVTLADAAWRDESETLLFLPAVIKSRFVQSNEIMAAQATKMLLDRLREEYEYVIVDLPPLAPVVDTRATTHLIDSYLFIIEWGETKTDVVEHALSRAPGISERVLGAVLNKVDMKQIDKYDVKNGSYYTNKHYAQYGYTQ